MNLNTAGFEAEGYQSRFAKHGRIRLEGVVSDADAKALHHALEQRTPWELQLIDEAGFPDILSREQLETLTGEEIQTRLQAAAERAQNGLSWLRLGLSPDALPLGHPLSGLIEQVRSAEFATFVEGLTGLSGLELSELNLVCYRPGDFLTQHTDRAARLCFEWSFTQGWRPDWGGQLLFHSPSGDVEGGVMPRMNDLCLFAGDQPRSVASVAPYAGHPRFSITGRFA